MKMLKSLSYDRTVVAAVDDALSHYARDEFASPTRSTVPLLAWLKHEPAMVNSLLQDLGMPAECNLHLEYRVKPPTGRGNASHSDLMVISGDSSLAIEAKWTEPRYDTVGKWLETGANPDNRRDVLAGWLGLLQHHASQPLHRADFTDAVYQMVHRAASACAAGGKPALAYLLFKPSPDPRTADLRTIRDDLTHLWSVLGRPSTFPFYLVELPLSRTTLFDALASLPKGNQITAQQVRAALFGSDRLFSFEKHRVTSVGEKA